MDTFKRNTQALASQQFDVCIVGGGISGAWLALHCAQSGLTTALIEKGDFASQTSSSSSKLLHGGIRYLQQFQFGKVRESAIERAHYIYAAPHLSTAVPFAVPTYRDFQRSKTFLRSGMLAYKSLCFGEDRIIESREEHLPPITSISSSGLNEICELEGNEHTGAVVAGLFGRSRDWDFVQRLVRLLPHLGVRSRRCRRRGGAASDGGYLPPISLEGGGIRASVAFPNRRCGRALGSGGWNGWVVR